MNHRSSMSHPLNQSKTGLRPMEYWWLWVLDTVLVTGAFLFYLATQYGTYEFFGPACLRALLPLIPVMVLVGGAGSTIFVLTKVLVEKRGWNKTAARALLLGQALVVALPVVALGAWKSPRHRLAYICAGHAPVSAKEVRLTGYSSFLREEWLTVFRVEETAFRQMVADAKLVPVDEAEFKKYGESSLLKPSPLFSQMPPVSGRLYFKRTFKEGTEHERGCVYAAFDPATATAVVIREYHD